jgi:dephospho-CoA kinase
MLIIGLTGSIGMGKSTAAARFRERGIAVFDADAEVHRLYEGPLVPAIESAFPGTVVQGKVDRSRLSALLLAEPDRFKVLEALVHPAVQEAQRRFLQSEHARGAEMAVLEVPLLLEEGRDRQVDLTIVVSAPPEIQRRRVLERPGMSPSKFEMIMARQLPENEKRSRADFIVDTSGSVENCNRQIDEIISKLRTRQGGAFDLYWRNSI